MRHRLTWIAIAAAAGTLAGLQTAAGANCSLRNPDRQIYEIFPDATSYRSIVANVDERVKPVIEAALGSSVSFNDLAKHTIYVVLKNDVPLGFIHPRSEIGRHGTVELVWALDLDLRVRDFRVQRCREKHATVVEDEAFRRRLLGCDHHGLREFLTDSNTRIDAAKLSVPADAEPIVQTALLCEAKTLIITEAAFGEQLSSLRLLGNVHRFFPEAGKVTKLTAPLTDRARSKAESILGSPLNQISADSLSAARALGAQGQPLGAVLHCQCTGLPQAEFWAAVSREGAFTEAVLVGSVSPADSATLSAVRGKQLSELGGATEFTSPLARCAREVLAVLAAHNAVLAAHNAE
jgi:hypothetical protein